MRRVAFPNERMMYKTYPINPIGSYVNRVSVYVMVFLPLSFISFFHIMFGKASTVRNFDNIMNEYVLPSIIGTLALFSYLLLSILIEDIMNKGWLKLFLPSTIFVLSNMGALPFYPFAIMNLNSDLDIAIDSSFTEISIVVILFLLTIISLNILYRKSKFYMESSC